MACKHLRITAAWSPQVKTSVFLANKTSCTPDTWRICCRASDFISAERMKRAAKICAELSHLFGNMHQGFVRLLSASQSVFTTREKTCLNGMPPKRSAFKETPRVQEILAHRSAELAHSFCKILLLHFWERAANFIQSSRTRLAVYGIIKLRKRRCTRLSEAALSAEEICCQHLEINVYTQSLSLSNPSYAQMWLCRVSLETKPHCVTEPTSCR